MLSGLKINCNKLLTNTDYIRSNKFLMLLLLISIIIKYDNKTAIEKYVDYPTINFVEVFFNKLFKNLTIIYGRREIKRELNNKFA